MRQATCLAAISGASRPEATVFWSGAGISADAPTSAPVGNTLADDALRYSFELGTAARLERYYSQLRLGRTRPRLETVLEIVQRVHGGAVLLDLLSDLEAPPNALHGFFAQHLAAGGRHVTANFDTCIERAADTASATAILHLHGALGEPQLGATLGRIERGLAPDVRSALDAVLLDDAIELIVFVGYSGSDFFDVDPYLRSLPGRALDGRTVVWLRHDEHAHVVTEGRQRQLAWLERAGARAAELAGPTRDSLDALGRAWGFEALGPAPPLVARGQQRIEVTDDAKARATLELYALMGLHREVAARLSDETEHQELLAHVRWAQGRYRPAGSAWARARATALPAARAERAGAVLWIRGEYARARDLLTAALERGDGSLEDQLLLAETLARVYEHAARFPDTRSIASDALRAFLLDRLPEPDELAARGAPLGTHVRQRVESVRRVLGAPVRESDAIATFGEFEALNAQLSYRHRAVRERLERGERVRRELRQQRDDFTAIGAHGDAARAVLLGGPAIFWPWEIAAAAWRLDVTPRHRLRLLAASVFGAWHRRRAAR